MNFLLLITKDCDTKFILGLIVNINSNKIFYPNIVFLKYFQWLA